MAGVTLKDVVKVYEGGVKVVDRVSLDIKDREFVVLVGPSGCGKSTTLRMIAGLEEITSGTISIGDRVVNDVPPKDRDIAMVFQSYALYPHMSVRENMAFAPKLRKVPQNSIAEKVKHASKILGIEHLLERKPKALSGGQRQRVALGRAIVRDPKCFSSTSRLSNLDAKLRVEMRAEIKQIHMGLNATTVYVTHDQEEAMTLGDRVVVMKDGIVQQVDGALDIYHHPTNRFVAGFLGSPPMNFFNGKLVSEGGVLYFDEGSGKLPVPDWAKASARGGASVRKWCSACGPRRFRDQQHALRHRQQLPPLQGHARPAARRQDGRLPRDREAPAQRGPHGRLSGVKAGDQVEMFVDLGRVHFFEPGETGKRIADKRR